MAIHLLTMVTFHKKTELKGTYHAKCTFVRLLYMNMCPRCSRELTKCQKTQPSLFSSTNQEETATAIAVRKRWRRCSTYARHVGGAVLTESALAKTGVKKSKSSQNCCERKSKFQEEMKLLRLQSSSLIPECYPTLKVDLSCYI